MDNDTKPDVVAIIGAGPAGLTAAYELGKANRSAVVFEADDVVGGISRTVEHDGWRCDIGGHRFFTKVRAVQDLWEEILPPTDFLVRPRMSRIYYEGKFYDYPIRVFNALKNLGLFEATLCATSFFGARLRRSGRHATLEDYIVANYGKRLFRHFFESYNEKVWGVPASAISADWGSQRIQGMSLFRAVWDPIRTRVNARRKSMKQLPTLIEQFNYPRLGPGMMWERCRDLVDQMAIPVLTSTPIVKIERGVDGVTAVTSVGDNPQRLPVGHVVSSMPLSDLVQILDPPPPRSVLDAARSLRYRDFLTVALVVPEGCGFPDNWIYVHDPSVKVGRIQNFHSWSPDMVKDGWTCLGLEYFVFEGDYLWSMEDSDLVALAAKELEAIGLCATSDISDGFVVRMPKAYPVYDETYKEAVGTIQTWLNSELPNVHPVGRNGMHKYNNQDHSMWTAMLSVENILNDAGHDIWAVNVEGEYHEAGAGTPSSDTTGRSAPVIANPRPAVTA